MIDWMIQVCDALKESTDATFFLAVSIMDRYFEARQKERVVLEPGELHIIGVTSIFISSKYEDVYSVTLKTIIN
jgi:hypothetical protein